MFLIGFCKVFRPYMFHYTNWTAEFNWKIFTFGSFGLLNNTNFLIFYRF